MRALGILNARDVFTVLRELGETPKGLWRPLICSEICQSRRRPAGPQN